MKHTKILLIALFFSFNAHANEFKFNEEASAILGEVIFYEDFLFRSGEAGLPGRSEKHMAMIESGIKRIKDKYPEKVQVAFLWSVMTRSSFGSHSAEMFVDLIYRHCKAPYLSALNSYLARDRKYNSTMTKKAEYIKHYLDQRNRLDSKD